MLIKKLNHNRMVRVQVLKVNKGEEAMKKEMIVVVFGITLLAFASGTFAGALCFQNNNGFFYILSGGKVNTKPYSGSLIISGVCQRSGNAAIFSNGANYQLTWNSAQNNTSNCASVIESLTFDSSLLTGSGVRDVFQDGDADANITWTRIDCSIVPSFKQGKHSEGSE